MMMIKFQLIFLVGFFVLIMGGCKSTNKLSSSEKEVVQAAISGENARSESVLDLDKPEDNLYAFAKVRGSLDENEEVIYYANGSIYGIVDGERDKHLMDYEMYNVGILKPNGEHSYQLLTREVLLYMDKKTGAVLESFDNPYTESSVEVLHVFNDPVNQNFVLEGKYGKWGVAHKKYGKDKICMSADILLAYPSPLTVEEYPENSQSDLYEAGELFQFFVSEKELNNPTVKSVDCTISWTRIGPWLPWMNMGQRPGKMLYQGAGYKLSGKDYNEMPAVLTDYVLSHKPEYRHAPAEYTTPNETSWTYYKKMNPRN